jgi:hypothetical protein
VTLAGTAVLCFDGWGSSSTTATTGIRRTGVSFPTRAVSAVVPVGATTSDHIHAEAA